MIISKRLIIRSLERKDFKQIYLIKNNPDVISGEGHFFSFPYEKLKKVYSSYLINNSKRKALVLEEKRRHRVIGEISLDMDWPNRCAEIGITIKRDHWGKGIATEALRAVQELAFKKMALNRLQAWILDSNAGSLKAFRNSGFSREGVFRRAKIHNGKFHDVVWVSVLKGDYKNSLKKRP